MERSSSAPALCRATLHNSEYFVPRHGLGLTGHANSIQLGSFPKDKGEFTSRLNQIARAGKKVPGPGTYCGHVAWADSKKTGSRRIDETVNKFGNSFPKSSRGYKQCNKVPDPGKYEQKQLAVGKSLGAKENLSQNPRTKLGKCAKGPRRSYLASAEERGRSTPAPGLSENVPRDRLDGNKRSLRWAYAKTQSLAPPKKAEPAPNHYNLQYTNVEDKSITYTVPKCASDNFIEKTVKGKQIWVRGSDRAKMPQPGPGAHDQVVFEKVTRGTKFAQMRGLSRTPMSGYL